MNRPYRLGLDIGTNSIGWFLIRLDPKSGAPVGLGPGGVRIFPDGRDPQSKTSNAVERRMARGARRRRDRSLSRQKDLMAALVNHALMPDGEPSRKALESLDPYELRATALDAPLPLHHVGRALFHLNQRRGFKSNRKSDAKDDDKGAIKEAAGRLKTAMAEERARTLGEFLWRRHREREAVRARNIGTGTKAAYDFYPTRDLLEEEFSAIWAAQAAHHPQMTPEARDEIFDIVFYQRPLRAPAIGKCQFEPAKDKNDRDGLRAPWCLPLAQRFRIAQEVRNLQIQETGQAARNLTREQGDQLILALLQRNKLAFDRMRSLLKLPAEARFNLESERRIELKGDQTAERLAHKDRFGKAWRALPPERQTEIVERLLDEGLSDDDLLAWLREDCGLSAQAAAKVAEAPLPEGHCRLGRRALAKIVPLMQQEGLRYFEAAARLYGDHAGLPTGELHPSGYLPYYGEWLPDSVIGEGETRYSGERRVGRVTNPTVHIGLNQVREVVNAVVRRHGPPQQIVVELARELKLSPKQKAEKDKEQAANERRNDERRALLAEQGRQANALDLMKLRLWEELNPKDPLDRKCPFTGETISLARLLSDEVEIEHLIPFSKCWDDSGANKIVCLRHANRAKGQRTPFEAFGGNPRINGFPYDWEAISARAAAMPHNKRWRFSPDALERFQEQGGFLGRQLNETGWLARMAKGYLSAICSPRETWVVPGRLTAMIRAKWGLNSLLPDHNVGDAKNRLDHRHHAIDALVAALTDRGLLSRMARAYDEERDRVEVPEPWENFREEVERALNAIVVSHKPDHGRQGKLHEATAYGLVAKGEQAEESLVVYRKPFLGLNEREIGRIRDERLREKVLAFVAARQAGGTSLPDALAEFADPERNPDPQFKHGLRHVRLLKPEKAEYLVTVTDRDGRPYKAMSAGQNLYVEIFETPDGRWHGEAVTVFAANQDGHTVAWRGEHPDARLVMRVHKGDLIALEHDGRRQVMVVRRLEPSASRFRLSPHNESGDLSRRHADPEDPFRWLMPSYSTLRQLGAERVIVDPSGFLWRVAPA